jgi:uncharacterized protein YbjT (DUF2867 family)
MTVLVTGSTGLVGNNVVRQLLSEGMQGSGSRSPAVRSSALGGFAVEVIQGDVRDSVSCGMPAGASRQ